MKLMRTYLSQRPHEWSAPMALLVWAMVVVASVLAWKFPVEGAHWVASRQSVMGTGGEWIRLFSSTFLHADLKHLLSNSVFFIVFGYLLFGYFGGWVFPVLSLIASMIVNATTLYFYPDHVRLLGASGMIYFMAGFWATLFFWVERKDRALRRMGVTLMALAMLFMPSQYEPNVSYLAHATGMGLGLVLGTFYFWFQKERLRAHEIYSQPEVEEAAVGNTQVKVVPWPNVDRTDTLP